ncbi:Smr/MutS family protein [Sphingomonas solaris]|uniref:DNA mismatch repair protein MutS n=1 Tax=Alterirhizorhabdus solaris TaxID=2529389 RepID=A0A558QZS1_9SPHN|nr:Smr/MutS family protein [Sphingomonas solaris]TVV72587.1 DNA mismatch repair protein MutS [Sphingomonas solaris]
MAGRQLDPEERALWHRVTDSVRPIVRVKPVRAAIAKPLASAPPPPSPALLPSKRLGRVPPPLPPRLNPKAAPPPDTLDGGWDRRLRRGMVAPDRAIDLHGHTLATAFAALDAELARAIAMEARLILLVTGRPPRERGHGEERPRGAIRASVGDWLAGSRFADRIAAVRNAHPRHGGAGALYVILRRRRERG